jgi:hypothetical protein
MHRKPLALVVAALAAVGSAQGQQGGPRKLAFGEPIVVDCQDPPAGRRRNFLWVAPVAFCWPKGGPVLVSLRGIKAKPVTDLWQEKQDRTWVRLGELPNVNWPSALVVGDDVGVVGSVGEDVSGGYGNAIRFFRVANGKAPEPAVVCRPPGRQDRLTVSSVNALGETISVFLLLEARGTGENRLLYCRSADGGRTWPKEPTVIAATTMGEDYSRLGSFQFSADQLGRFVAERTGPLLFYRSADAGRTWTKQTVQLRDELPAAARRLPLASVGFKAGIGLVYLGVDPAGRDGRYYFTRSADRGGTWQAASAISDPVKVDDPAIFARAAASGQRVAMSFVETTGQWTQGEMRCRLVVSQDGGRTWRPEPLEKHYNGVALFSALGSAPGEDRLLFATAICIDPQTNARNYLVVQELSTRARRAARPADLGQEDRKTIAGLIERLGDEELAVREAATRKLATFGLAAKQQLQAALKSKDPEVAARAERILQRIFPECIRPRSD